MPQRESLTTVTFITDHDTSTYHIGEIDGLFQKVQLYDYLRRFGEKGYTDLIAHLAYLQHQVVEARLELQLEIDLDACQSDKSTDAMSNAAIKLNVSKCK